MIIDSAELKNFRNYKDEKIQFSAGMNFLSGMNAQGKTNVLEALFFCGCGKSHRTNKDAFMVREGEEELSVKTNIIYDNGIKREIKLIFNAKTKKKELYINGKKQPMGELFGKMQMVFFSPEDLMLIKEGPAVRRRMADIALSQAKPAYFHDLSKYIRILTQKNNLLKEIKKNTRMIETLDIWSENLARYGARVILKRREFLKELSEIAAKKHEALSDGKEVLEIKYLSSVSEEEKTEETTTSLLYGKYLENREKEIFTGATFIGPHRDDILFNIDGREAKNFASQGQQRSAVLSLKMAQLDYIGSISGEKPVLLLDDVFSELDEKRRKYMYNNTEGIQTFITGTGSDVPPAVSDGGARFFIITEGSVREGKYVHSSWGECDN